MGDNKEIEDDLVDYEEYDDEAEGGADKDAGGEKKGSGHYAGIHNASFRDFLLKPELLKAIGDCGFEHPSEVQQECIPQAMLGMDVICQAKSGMGKTAVFVLTCLQQTDITEANANDLLVIVMGHTRELAFQICQEFSRFTKYLPGVKTKVIFGGVPITDHKTLLKDEQPNIIVGTPGRVKALVNSGDMKTDKVKIFVLDECDKMLESLDMRSDVQQIFQACPRDKQVMMFSATLSQEIRPVCKKFMQDPLEIFVDESKLTLHGLQQYYIQLEEAQKTRKLTDLLDDLEFNQVVIFVKSISRAKALTKILTESNFPSIDIHRGISQQERLQRYKDFKDFKKRILVSTDLLGRGIDIERINIVINYDMPDQSGGRGEVAADSDSTQMVGSNAYLHRVGRAGRFGTKGLAISFIAKGTAEIKVLEEIQTRFETEIPEMPETIDVSSYMTS